MEIGMREMSSLSVSPIKKLAVRKVMRIGDDYSLSSRFEALSSPGQAKSGTNKLLNPQSGHMSPPRSLLVSYGSVHIM